jgi:exosortase A-associated hydrolase 2
MSRPAYTISARFNGHAPEKFLTVDYMPKSRVKAHIIYIPPLAEEMNRCRALVATQAREFAELGFSCTLVDLFGTGDSEGELHRASLERWYENIDVVVQALCHQDDKPIYLWGLRLGGLLALDYCARSQHPVENIILWQTVSSSKRFVTQLLRQRVASLVSRGLPPETAKDIRQRLDNGEKVEISGYVFGGKLLSGIEAIDLSEVGPLCSGKIVWLENSDEPGQELGASARKMTESLKQQGNIVEVLEFTDPPLWQLHKRDDAPQLLQLTGSIFS